MCATERYTISRMQSRLESKVQSLRSQGLRFEKDGFDVREHLFAI
jgi:hypothetical protein